jgi:hypothetical protein
MPHAVLRLSELGRRWLVILSVGFVAIVLGGSVGAARTEAASPSFRLVSCTGAVGWQKARQMIGRVATLRGYVAGTKYASFSNGSPTFLNVGVDYPSSRRLTVVIWQENRAKFGRPETRYLHRTICVRGFVNTYAGVPQIEATTPTQIAVVRFR